VLSIGQFSRATGFSIKTLRFYHERGLLIPASVDEQTGYRYYDDFNLDRARIIAQLRKMELPLEQIKEILDRCEDESDVLDYLQRHKRVIEAKIAQYQDVVITLEQIISNEREARTAMGNSTFEVEEKVLQPMLIAGVRYKGKYSDCGNGFAKIGKALGRFIRGKPFCLYYDGEYREDDADIEACMPISQERAVDGISVRELPGGRCLALIHKGPYQDVGRSYAKILKHLEELGLKIVLPSREVYLKGPGMIFRGNPRKYLTEIQMLIEE
jgi:DNA-binding transcriptional MerR regulator/effector-binding domain-containing protein